jgi:zona occludens toxin
MAIVIEHGPNGSYKTASVVWHRIVPALREGRCVVTNVLGMYPLEEIEEKLGEKFPDSARLFRIFAVADDTRELWRRWFHWMPIGALVVIDECQDIFSLSGWKSTGLDLQPIDIYKNHLPASLIQYFKDTHDSFRPEIRTCDTDDAGRLLLNADGSIIYPPNLNEAFSRHRHFNWDIVFVTPNLKEFNDLVRACAEVAYSYANKDSFFIRKRKPRIYEHPPKETGIPGPRSPVFTRHVPVAVHMLYKSTQTGATVKSGQSVGPLSTFKGKFVVFFLIPACFVYLGYLSWSLYQRHAANNQPATVSASAHIKKTTVPASRPAGADVSKQVVASSDIFVMPFDADKIWVSGVSGYIDNFQHFQGVIVFNMEHGKDESSIDDSVLQAMGYSYQIRTDCVIELSDSHGHKQVVTCKPLQHEPAPAGRVDSSQIIASTGNPALATSQSLQ